MHVLFGAGGKKKFPSQYEFYNSGFRFTAASPPLKYHFIINNQIKRGKPSKEGDAMGNRMREEHEEQCKCSAPSATSAMQTKSVAI